MTRRLWLNPAMGVAGDMTIAALLDVGADEAHVRRQLEALELPGWQLSTRLVERAALRATAVTVAHDEHHHHRSWSTIDGMLDHAASTGRLGVAVAAGARTTFRELAVAEATVHGIDVDDVHFHEVGALDAIVDIVGAWAALDSLGVDEVVSAPIGIGTAVVDMAHGAVPVPAPATLELLVGLPTRPLDVSGETATPTGVALLRTMVDRWGPLPAGTVRRTGRGAGSWDPPSHANVLTAVRSDDVGPAGPGTEAVASVVLETNVDDVTPEILGHVVEQLLLKGADDAWITPITMKKARPGHVVAALCRPALADELRALLVSETGTLGVRQRQVDKFELPRRTERVEVRGQPVRMKVGPHGAKPEHDDVVALAARTGVPARTIATEAARSWARRNGETQDPGDH